MGQRGQTITGGFSEIDICRSNFADPELPIKAREGRFEDVRPCISCCRCLVGPESRKTPIICSVNPEMGNELEHPAEPAKETKRIFVIGGGPAGMEAAIVASQSGHRVTLFEKKERLGGQLLLAAVPPYKGDIANWTEYVIR